MMGSDILALIAAAAQEGHDRERIGADMAAGMVALRDRLPHPLGLSRYLQRRLNSTEYADGSDVGQLLVAFRPLVGADEELKGEMTRVGFLAARLGGVDAMLALGPQVIEALRAIPARPPS